MPSSRVIKLTSRTSYRHIYRGKVGGWRGFGRDQKKQRATNYQVSGNRLQKV
jgi:hypothetical protein